MTVRELIETLEELPLDLPVVENGYEITEIVVRDEIYLTADNGYRDGQIVKVY
jgi:hypothetical protein